MPTTIELARDFALEFIRKSGVREYDEPPEVIARIYERSWELASLITGDDDMAVTAVFRAQQGIQKLFKSSAGDAAITLVNLPNSTSELTGARQSAKLDLGSPRGEMYDIDADLEFAATPTAGNVVEFWWAPSDSGTAGTNNPGNASGADAAYTGYSNNISASLKHCQLIGAFVCTAQVTATVQKKVLIGSFSPPDRYGSLILFNKSGAAIHSSDANCVIRFTRREGTSEPS